MVKLDKIVKIYNPKKANEFEALHGVSAEIMELFKSLNAQGRTVIIVTHDPKVAEQCDRVIEISDGEIVG